MTHDDMYTDAMPTYTITVASDCLAELLADRQPKLITQLGNPWVLLPAER